MISAEAFPPTQKYTLTNILYRLMLTEGDHLIVEWN